VLGVVLVGVADVKKDELRIADVLREPLGRDEEILSWADSLRRDRAGPFS
jgi:hypothetical protein